ncbi:hypothetical protein LOTGIDRAFT_171869 [Lottia gigantea]|uniref:Uncharacterized protein n=1 Tax=Lottia gigantea TaxID=225164 RepID=V4AF70_LOTGI|nr:hypothetical protein LOTGIDRAFT_171869 [Lottia gigantea]ESP02669.1 hypothetical protein LOTGIDRAFT_171869 [Lottia gigantea]
MSLKTVTALYLLVASAIFNVIGFSSPYWLTGNIDVFGRVWYGLWLTCYDILEDCINTDQANQFGWEKGVAAMEILGFMALVASCCFLLLAFLFCHSRQSLFTILSGSFAIAAGVFMFIGVIIFGAEFDNTILTLSWAFVLVLISALTSIASGILLIVEFKSAKVISI